MAVLPRWYWADATGDAWTMQRNPNRMSSPHGPRTSTIFSRSFGESEASVARVLTFRQQPYEWSFAGDVRTQEMYEDLLAWTKKTRLIDITDHLSRTWRVRIVSADITELRTNARNPWRFSYEVKALMYGRIA